VAVLSTERVTMYDLAELSHNGQLLDMVTPLTRAEDLAKDIPWYEANDISSHRVVKNGSLVTGTWRNFNAGFDATKGAETPGREEIGRLEARLEVDVGILDMERDKRGFIMRKEYAHMEGLGQQLGDALVEGSVADGFHFDGLHPRTDSLTITDAFGQSIVHDYGGSGSDLMSIYAIQWGADQVYGVYPRGHQYIGIDREERGVERVLDSSSKAFYAYVVRYQWSGGLVVADDRCVRRICNIETAGATNNLLDASDDVDQMIDALISMKDMGSGAILYMNRTAYGQLWKAAKDKTNVYYNVDNPWKAPDYYFGANQVRFTDALKITDGAVA